MAQTPETFAYAPGSGESVRKIASDFGVGAAARSEDFDYAKIDEYVAEFQRLNGTSEIQAGQTYQFPYPDERFVNQPMELSHLALFFGERFTVEGGNPIRTGELTDEQLSAQLQEAVIMARLDGKTEGVDYFVIPRDALAEGVTPQDILFNDGSLNLFDSKERQDAFRDLNGEIVRGTRRDRDRFVMDDGDNYIFPLKDREGNALEYDTAEILRTQIVEGRQNDVAGILGGEATTTLAWIPDRNIGGTDLTDRILTFSNDEARVRFVAEFKAANPELFEGVGAGEEIQIPKDVAVNIPDFEGVNISNLAAYSSRWDNEIATNLAITRDQQVEGSGTAGVYAEADLESGKSDSITVAEKRKHGRGNITTRREMPAEEAQQRLAANPDARVIDDAGRDITEEVRENPTQVAELANAPMTDQERDNGADWQTAVAAALTGIKPANAADPELTPPVESETTERTESTALPITEGVNDAALKGLLDNIRVAEGTPTLRVASKASGINDPEQVMALQRNLIDLGYDLGEYGPNGDGVDGIYGQAVKAAVADLQKQQGLTGKDVDGIYGPKTAEVMQLALVDKTVAVAKAAGESVDVSNQLTSDDVAEQGAPLNTALVNSAVENYRG